MAKTCILKIDDKSLYYHTDNLLKKILFWHQSTDLVLVVESTSKYKDLMHQLPEYPCMELNVLKMTLGLIVSDLLSLLKSAAIPAVSLNGISFLSVDNDHNLSMDEFLIEQILKIHYIPVIYPLASDRGGNAFKTDTDQLLSFLYKKLNSSELLIIDDSYNKGRLKTIENLKVITTKELAY